ncbi:MAG: hypothetical protein LBF08_00120 [Dysgonamonadaceae bacterium]|jgi:hypothetical protein|nr:hypothetical protein [Dysgonamonadaceae bacterium]
MRRKNFFWLLATVGLMTFTAVLLSGCKNDDGGGDDGDGDEPNEPGVENFIDGSDFYIFLMDEVSIWTLGDKVKVPTMLRDYDVWPDGTSLTGGVCSGENAFGEPYTGTDVVWTSFVVTPAGVNNVKWNGGAIVGQFTRIINGDTVDMYPKGVPNLKEVTDNPNDYWFHFAIKSPPEQSNAGCTLIFFSDGTPTKDGDVNDGGGLKYYFGPKNKVGKLDTYEHNGEWQHIEIPVSRMVADGYRWDGPIRVWTTNEGGDAQNRPYLLGFVQEENIEGYEINLDAMFFYKKKVQTEE